AFFSKRKDQQVSISSQQDKENPNSFLFYTANAGSGWIQGLEWEYSRTVTHGTQLFTTLGYLDTWVDEFGYQLDTATAGSGGNREAAMSPKVTGSVGLSYHTAFGIFTSVQLSHKGKYYFSDSHDQMSEPYSLVNLTVGKSFRNGTIKFWARNMLDERYAVRGFYFGLIPPDYPDQLWKSYGDPRQIGITLDYNY
ncbi:MAG TPA: TonB-dependent receptor, partial [Candidatus Marinimicrobia bacterium]|nr:TonB-dependent receptor [Candidatus Neomarinimicrobiota bacterium]